MFADLGCWSSGLAGCHLMWIKYMLARDAAGASDEHHRELLISIVIVFTSGMATTKLRKTFRYPADDSEEDASPQALDEEGMLKGLLAGRCMRHI